MQKFQLVTCEDLMLCFVLNVSKLNISGYLYNISKELSCEAIWKMISYTLRVEMRQRQSPSLVLLFLCLKPPIIRSHTN